MEKKALASLRLYCEKRQLPVAIENNPRLSWLIDDRTGGFRQQAYRIRVASKAALLGEPDV